MACEASEPQALEFKRGNSLYVQGELVPFVDCLDRGTLVSQKYHIDGHVQLVNSYIPPSVVNLEAVVSRKGTSPTTIIANSPCRVIRIPYNNLVHNRKIPVAIRIAIFDNIVAAMADESIRFMNKSDILSRHKVKERAIIFMDILRERYNSNSFDIGMNQEEFAQYLCVDRSTLSEALNELRRKDQIEFQGSIYTLKFPET
ncbi:MAG: Crp/Fnr family transcriptional regulator [Clostridiales Family XIII bacterium]|nr:Crp/Fnr family transcriptional regulator [Clostridiales Family XIII bacterium]